MIKYTTTLRVRYKETDQMGVVYYSNYMVWFEVARAELFRDIGYPYSKIEKEMGLWLMVVEAQCSYKLPARYDELIDIECCLDNIKNSGMTFSYRVIRKKKILAVGKTTHVFTNSAGIPKRVPQSLREALEVNGF